MENKINIAELLRDCINGMELDCIMFDNAKFIGVENYCDKPICIRIGNGDIYLHLTKFSTWDFDENAKCIIFPKGKTTWKGFVPLCNFKNGDIMFKGHFIAIVSHIESDGRIWYHCWYDTKYKDCKIKKDYGIGNINDGDEIRFATEEEKQKLFDAIKDKGYKWNAETKTLEKLPKFKVGDKVQWKEDIREKRIIDNVLNNCYTVQGYGVILFTAQDEWELVPNKFDITTLKPFDKVLVRDFDNGIWDIELFSRLLDGKHFKCLDVSYAQCIPYDKNEHLLGTTNDCDDFYKTW